MTSKMLVSSIWNDGVGKTNGKAIVARGNGKYYIGYNDWDASGTRAFSVIRSTDIECGTWEKMINKDTSMYFEYISNAVAGTAGSGTEVMLFTAQGGLYEGRTSSRSLAYITRIEFRGSPLTSFAATSISLPFTH